MNDTIERHVRWLATVRDATAKTVADRRRVLYHADRHLSDGVTEAYEEEIGEYLAGALRCQSSRCCRPEKRWGGWTRVTYHNHLKGFYAWGARKGILAFNPMADMADPQSPDPVPHPCSNDEVAAMLTTPPQPWRRAVVLAAYGGLRCAEICRAHANDIIGDRLKVHGKGRKTRLVPIGPQLRAELGANPGGWLLTVPDPYRDRALTADGSVDPHWLTHRQRFTWARLGLRKGVSWHDLRHWYATRLLEGGVDVRVIQQLLGHASLDTTMRYLGLTEDRITKAGLALPTLTVEPAGTRLDLRAA